MSMRLFFDESLKTRASFRTGGNADVLVLPESEDDLVFALEKFGSKYVFGNLSNTLITDGGIRGNVIITTSVKGVAVNGENVTCLCGDSLSSFASSCRDNSLTGAEFCYGIPGTIGGGVFMNCGAYGGQLSDILTSVKLWSEDKGVFTLENEEMDFSYRKSIVQTQPYIVLSATFGLKKGNKAEIGAKMDELMASRRAKQPLEYPSCGSTFKRPEGHFAGALIEQCGLKGYTVGGASVSEKHAGFVINSANATSDDILSLVEYIKKTVFDKTNVLLEEEIRIVGER